MKKLFAVFVVLIFCSKTSLGQTFNPYFKSDVEIIKIDSAADPFVKVYTRFFVNDSGIANQISFLKIECSVCNDSLINDGKERATEYIKQSHYKIGYYQGKAIGVYYNLPLIFKY